MKRYLLPVISILCFHLFASRAASGQTLSQIESHRIMLPNGWALTPVGQSIKLGDLPLNIHVSPSGKLMAVSNNGQSGHTIDLIDPKTKKVLDTAIIGKAWLGLAFSTDDKSLYAAGGYDNWIIRYDISEHKLVAKDTLVLDKKAPVKICPSGIALDDAAGILYVVTKESNELILLDVRNKKVLTRMPLGGEGYTCLLSADKKLLFITCWGCNKVVLFNTITRQFQANVMVGSNPNDMCLSKDGKYLYVANANDNSVSVVDLAKLMVNETLNAALYPNAPSGSTTNGVALSEDNKTLYIANADNNCLAVFDVTKPGASVSKGFVPVGWYPTCVRVVGQTVFVSNGKGFSSFANPKGPNPTKKRHRVNYQSGDNTTREKEQYIGGLFLGTMSIFTEPTAAQLQVYAQAVYHNTPYSKNKELNAPGAPGNAIPMLVGNASPIKYVFYVIKENRTYDQVLSDIPGGNGDTSLLVFGHKYTPNQHAICKEFVLLDNFYVDAEVSADGHNWSCGAYANDYMEKTWPTSYGGRGGSYDAEGFRDIANNKNGFIWDFCKRYGVTYRTYGEFATHFKPNIPVLKDHVCPHFEGWDLDIRDTTRYYAWQRDFDSLLAIGKVPAVNTVRFSNDHTSGVAKGKPTPFAFVADNDLAVGLLVEHLSHSPIWKQSVVFILEDDAQNGSDHIDAHRSTAYVAGGLVKTGYVDHTVYSTSGMLRTLELIAGLPPMSQYDAAAMPMWRCFNDTSAPVHAPYTVKSESVDLTEVNVAVNKWSIMSDGFDLAGEDRVPNEVMNAVIWAAAKGEKPAPVIHHAAFIQIATKGDDD